MPQVKLSPSPPLGSTKLKYASAASGRLTITPRSTAASIRSRDKTMLTVGQLPSDLTSATGFVFSLLLNPWFLAGMACYATSIGSWIIVLSKTEVSLAYPLASIGYIMTAVVGYYCLGENVDIARISGIALICCGILLIAWSA
jgi:multidrug transporter EmrE-like cation transporter